MFERFTDRARRVVVLAQEESRAHDHTYIGTEHLLLGLVHEAEGVAVQVLQSLGISLEGLRQQVEEIIGRGPGTPSGYIPFTPRAKTVLELSLREALQFGHTYVGSEHLLLGLIREDEGVAAQVLVRLGADLNRVRAEVIRVLGQPPRSPELPLYDPPPNPFRPLEPQSWQLHEQPDPNDASAFRRFTDRSRRAIVLAQEEARILNHNYIGSEHLLLGLIQEGEGVAARALENLGVSLEGVRTQVEEIIGMGEQRPSGALPFTPRAKKVLELSLREALQLGNNYIGTEHLLLALIRQGEGVAPQVLVRLGADLNRTRQEVIRILAAGMPGNRPAAPTFPIPGPPSRPPGERWTDPWPFERPPRQPRTDHTMFGRFTDRARRAVVLAQEEARSLNHHHMGTEHLLLGLIGAEGLPAELLTTRGLGQETARDLVERLGGIGADASSGHIPFTPALKEVVSSAWDEAYVLRLNYVGVEHLLFALLRQDTGLPAEMLAHLGLSRHELRAQAIELLGGRPAPAPPAGTAARAVVDWARRQAATLGRGEARQADALPAELRTAVLGLVLLAQADVYLPASLLVDLVRLTGGGESLHHQELAGLRAHPGIRRLRALHWPPTARVAFAALMMAQVPADSAWVAPPVAATELREALFHAIHGEAAAAGAAPDEATPGEAAPGEAAPGEAAPGEATPPVSALDAAANQISERTVTMLLVLGAPAAAADPAAVLRMQHDTPAVPLLTGPQRALLESVANRPPRDTRAHAPSTAPGPGTTGISRRGRLTNLLPTQLALPPQLLTHRYAERSLLYRLHEVEIEPAIEPVVILLDTSPPTFGQVEVVLRIAAHAITTTLWAARQAPLLVCLDQPRLQLALNRPSDLARVWAHRSLLPPAVDEALAAARPTGRPCVLLTQYHLVEDSGVAGSAELRLITTHVRDDDPAAAVNGPFHAHLAPDPTTAQLAAAVRVALAPETAWGTRGSGTRPGSTRAAG
jgi:hypothetical protein